MRGKGELDDGSENWNEHRLGRHLLERRIEQIGASWCTRLENDGDVVFFEMEEAEGWEREPGDDIMKFGSFQIGKKQ